MTEDEAQNIKLETMNELADLRQRSTCLTAKIEKFMEQTTSARETLGCALEGSTLPIPSRQPSKERWPSFDDMQSTIEELRSAKERIRELENRLRQWKIID